MILFYTGAFSNEAPQVSADKSLGGYVSSSLIPNGRLNNIFSQISKSTVINKKQEIRMIALKNTTGSSITNAKIYTNIADGSVKLKVAAVAPAIVNGVPVFESIQDSNSLPYQASLDLHEGEVNAINTGIILPNAIIGIWILREIDATKYPDLLPTGNLTTEQLAALLESAKQVGEESISLLIKY